MKNLSLVVLGALFLTSLSFADHAEESHAEARNSCAEAAATPVVKASFNEVWNQIESDPYKNLPEHIVTLASFGSLTRKLREAARQTIEDTRPIRPPNDKLVHPIGICFSGTWNITEDTPYTGYFKKGAKGMMIARASSAMGETEAKDFRALGLAGRIFPTDAPSDVPMESANFFTVDDLGGTDRKHFVTGTYSNEPPITKRLSIVGVGLATATAFGAADSNPGLRQVYEIAELGMADKSKAKSPKRMNLVAEDGQVFDAKDFRDELRLKNHNGKLRFKIMVSDRTDGKGMRQIGFMEFTKDAASESCDKRFHVHHPVHKDKYEK